MWAAKLSPSSDGCIAGSIRLLQNVDSVVRPPAERFQQFARKIPALLECIHRQTAGHHHVVAAGLARSLLDSDVLSFRERHIFCATPRLQGAAFTSRMCQFAATTLVRGVGEKQIRPIRRFAAVSQARLLFIQS